MMRLATAFCLFSTAAPAFADHSNCWGLGTDDKSRPEITCEPLTETLLLSLRNATRAEVVKVMNARGREAEIGLHYLSNSENYSGDANFTFEDDRVVIISALVSTTEGSKTLNFIWNSKLGGCSDFPGSHKRC